jgi:hypothetical protein
MSKYIFRQVTLFTVIYLISFGNTEIGNCGSIINVIDTLNGHPCRILSGTSPNEFWICEPGVGLGNLVEPQSGIWEYTEYITNSGQDACGPDLYGKIYLSDYSQDYPGGGFQVFDTNLKIIEDTILLSESSPTSGIALSPDQSSLILLGWGWPVLGEGMGFYDGFRHPDTGIIWEIDLTSHNYEIMNQGYTAALPKTLFYETNSNEFDQIYVYCAEIQSPPSINGLLDVLNVDRALPRTTQLNCPAIEFNYVNAIIDWSYSDPFVAVCAENVLKIDNAPEYLEGLWIINTETNQVVETIPVTSSHGHPIGVTYALVSQVNPGVVYISPGLGDYADELIVMDYYTHEIVDYISFDAYDHMVPWFIYEMADGRLIITSGSYSKIAIVDPTC